MKKKKILLMKGAPVSFLPDRSKLGGPLFFEEIVSDSKVEDTAILYPSFLRAALRNYIHEFTFLSRQ
jgi:hypothetical protein